MGFGTFWKSGCRLFGQLPAGLGRRQIAIGTLHQISVASGATQRCGRLINSGIAPMLGLGVIAGLP
jgi:hypothetical protein